MMTEESGFDFQQAQHIFLFSIVIRPALKPTTIASYLMGASQGLKRPGKEAYRLPTFPYVFMV
jgi:hypothetical protein